MSASPCSRRAASASASSTRELDRQALAGMAERDTAKLASLPRTWMQGSQGEALCWIAAAGASDHLQMELLDYIPGYRSPAGTGCGLAFARWQ